MLTREEWNEIEAWQAHTEERDAREAQGERPPLAGLAHSILGQCKGIARQESTKRLQEMRGLLADMRKMLRDRTGGGDCSSYGVGGRICWRTERCRLDPTLVNQEEFRPCLRGRASCE